MRSASPSSPFSPLSPVTSAGPAPVAQRGQRPPGDALRLELAQPHGRCAAERRRRRRRLAATGKAHQGEPRREISNSLPSPGSSMTFSLSPFPPLTRIPTLLSRAIPAAPAPARTPFQGTRVLGRSFLPSHPLPPLPPLLGLRQDGKAHARLCAGDAEGRRCHALGTASLSHGGDGGYSDSGNLTTATDDTKEQPP